MVLHFGLMVGESKRMQEVYELVEVASTHNQTVLIEGETGTGKELVARAIHNRRNGGRFVAVNCTAIPRELFESELFGAEKGAFTGATQRRIGRFELANGGTLLLDEIGEMDKDVQPKLLRVLEERSFYRVGGAKEIGFNGRVIASTNAPLSDRIRDGGFREDLYFRLSEFTIHLPPLRERKEDIPLLVDHFIRNGGKSISEDALDRLMEYDWPGNIRELRNVLNRAIVVSKGSIINRDEIQLPVEKRPSKPDCITIPYGLTLDEVEEMIIKHMLRIYDGDKKRVAKILQISISTLYNKLKRFG